jgi:LmbE family N-acetylglucosaminyl deacetylase
VKLFISPHNDDEALFGAFTILREKPMVFIVTDSARQMGRGISASERRKESLAAMKVLGAEVEFMGIPDAALNVHDFNKRINEFIAAFGPFEHIYAPAFEAAGNVDHNLIAEHNFDLPVTRYLTYTKSGKSRSAKMVHFENDWPLLKLQALTCYRTQIFEPSTRDHFLREQYEYYA